MSTREVNVRLNVDIPHQLKKRIKIHCAKEGIDMKELVIASLETFLAELDKRSRTSKFDSRKEDV